MNHIELPAQLFIIFLGIFLVLKNSFDSLKEKWQELKDNREWENGREAREHEFTFFYELIHFTSSRPGETVWISPDDYLKIVTYFASCTSKDYDFVTDLVEQDELGNYLHFNECKLRMHLPIEGELMIEVEG